MKTNKEILEQIYISTEDLKQLMPSIGINRCREYMKEIKEEMELKGYKVPTSRNLLVLTKLVRKKFGI